MRIWHKQLIPYLPDKQLLIQFRDCWCIARNIHKNGLLSDVIVNRVLNYPDDEFNTYTISVVNELKTRGHEVDPESFWRWRYDSNTVLNSIVFRGWHTNRYLKQCMYNLQELYDCRGMSDEEWQCLMQGYKKITGGEEL